MLLEASTEREWVARHLVRIRDDDGKRNPTKPVAPGSFKS